MLWGRDGVSAGVEGVASVGEHSEAELVWSYSILCSGDVPVSCLQSCLQSCTRYTRDGTRGHLIGS